MPGEHDDRTDEASRRQAEEPLDDHPSEEGARKSRFSRITKVLMDRGEDARSVLGSVLDTSDRARSEMVKMVAREVRNYLEALKLTEDLRDFATHHSLEVQASFRLKPVGKETEEPKPPAKPPKGEEPGKD